MKQVKISSFGVVPNTEELLTTKIQKAIDICAQREDTLVLEKGEYRTGTLILQDNSDIYLEDGAVLYGSDDPDDYYMPEGCSFVDAVGQERGKAFLLAYKKKNVSIGGKGVIFGNGSVFTDSRPFLVRVIESENINLDGITLKDAGAWCFHICNSGFIDIKNVNIETRVNENNDGIDIDASHHVTIEGCNINSGDDGLCIKSTSLSPCEYVDIKNCSVSSGWGGFKIGTESVGDIHHISIQDCRFYDITGGAIKIVPTDGANVSDITIKNIEMINCTGPIFIVLGERLRKYAGIGRSTLSTMRNITIENITADVYSAPVRGFYFNEIWGHAKGGIIISGTKKNYIKDLTLKNIKAKLPGGVAEYEPHEVPYICENYPEFHRMDILPAKGIYVRNTENARFENITLIIKEQDCRDLIVSEECTNLYIDNIKESKANYQ